jgi:photosystem II stability/assembly factor-like uncharacterized protein
VALAGAGLTPAAAQPYGSSHFGGLAWRMIGPHRGGRTKAAVGIPAQPHVFYIGVVNGGVWKTTDAGRTWTPIFDDQPTGSIGAIAIAPSNAEVLYVGSGEGMQRPDLSVGNGMYKSTDGGRTWTHLGLADAQQIAQIVVDPRDENRLFVAALGHPYGPNAERGLFRSTDGGRTYEKVLYRDEHTGAADVVLDPVNPDIVYAVLWEARQGPWENAVFTGPGSGLFKSTDGGTTWRPLVKGLPTFANDGLGRIGITVAPSLPSRLFATVEARRGAGIYRSDDAGESWTRVNDDPRVVARPNDAAEVRVHPTNPDIVFVPTIVAWKSADGGKTFEAFRGAPGGDDYQRLWINPTRPDVMIMSADQGAIVTLNGGETWSSWYNQPTAQFYHVSTDNAFPYRVCGGQQESGSACVSSRGNDGQVTFREWHPVGVEEYGYVAADPVNPDIVYGGKVSRYDRRTGQVQNVSPRPLRGDNYRVIRTQPVLFSPIDSTRLYFSSNVVWMTVNEGRDWLAISPDLTRETWDVPESVAHYRNSPDARPTRRGVIYTIAPSPLEIDTLWAGTDDGLIHVTRDGGQSWRDVTPPSLTAWAKVSLIDASHFDAGTAYAAINTLRLDDLRPHIYRTRDGGATWTRIVSGIPDGTIVNAVREDPKRRGLLYAGTEQEVLVSFDDGDNWQSLRLNMPATSIRDLVVKDDDLVVGTHGRSFWILDNVTPLRQLGDEAARADVHLFEPQQAWRVRWNMNTDTPLPPDEPAGQNPPDGALIDYRLAADAPGPIRLEILDATGRVIRAHASDDPVEAPVEGRNTPDYWLRPPQVLSAKAGTHRFVWDLRLAPPAVLTFTYPIAAIHRNTPREPRGPLVPPGRYAVRLTAAGRTLTRELTVRLDPRVELTDAHLRDIHATARRIYDLIASSRAELDEMDAVRDRIRDLRGKAPNPLLTNALDATDQKVAGIRGSAGGFGGGSGPDSLARVNAQLAQLLDIVDEVDARPTPSTMTALAERQGALETLTAQWRGIVGNDLVALNELLARGGLETIPLPPR